MDQQFSDMYALLKGDSRAWKLYNMLPDHIREDISTHPADVNTFEGLRSRAQNLMGGRR